MSFNFDPSAGQSESSSSVDLKRRLAAALIQQGMDTSPIRSPWQGAARLSEALMGGLAVRRQADQEQAANAQVMAAITGQPYTPPAESPGLFGSLFGGGKGVSAASGAQGQIAATNPAPVPSTDSAPAPDGMQGYQNAISSIESSGNYGAVGPKSPTMGRALGKYQVMEANIGPWSQEALGRTVTPDEFLANPQIQDAIFNKKFGDYVKQYGPNGAAQAWFAGPGGVGKLDRQDSLGTSVAAYTDKFSHALGASAPTPAEQAIQQQMPQQQQVASLDPGAGIPAPGAAGQMQANNPAPVPQTPAQQAPMPQAAPVPAPQPIPQAAAPQPDAPPQQKLAQALQSQGTVGGNPLAGNPRAQALMQAVMNPYASPQARSLAGAMLQQTMQPHTQLITNPNTGTTYLVNTITGEKQLVDQGQTADSELEKDASGLPMGTFNKRTGQYTPLANAPQGMPGLPAGVAPTDDYKNWQIAKANGDPRDFSDYQADLRKAGAQSVTLAGETEESKALGQARAKNVVSYMEAGPDARNKMQTLQIMADALKAGNGNFSTGPGAEAILNAKQAIGNFLGTNLDGVAPAEIYKKMGAYLASSAAKDLAQRPTQFDFKTFLQNNPGLDISPQGNEFMINIMQQQAQHQMDLSQMAQSYKGPTADWNDVVAQYDKTHPIMSPITGKPLDPSEKMFPGGHQQNQSAPGAKPAPPVGTIEQGYRFKGGDPSKPENWEQAL